MIKKVEAAEKFLKHAKKAEEAHQSDIQELKSELRMVERKKEEFDEQEKEESKKRRKAKLLEPVPQLFLRMSKLRFIRS